MFFSPIGNKNIDRYDGSGHALEIERDFTCHGPAIRPLGHKMNTSAKIREAVVLNTECIEIGD